MKEENMKEDILTSGTKGTQRIKSNQELQNLYKGSDIVAHIKRKIGMDRTSSKNRL